MKQQTLRKTDDDNEVDIGDKNSMIRKRGKDDKKKKDLFRTRTGAKAAKKGGKRPGLGPSREKRRKRRKKSHFSGLAAA